MTTTLVLESGGCRRQALTADPREAKKPQIGWLFSVVLVRVSAGHQPTVRLSRSDSRGQVSHLPAPSSRALVAVDDQESETNGRIGDG